MITVWHYVAPSGTDPFEEWLDALADIRAQARIAARVNRLAAENFGDCKPLREGVWEMRINWGPGYRVYYALTGRTAVLLLCGGDKRRQAADIQRAVDCWKDYEKRSGMP